MHFDALTAREALMQIRLELAQPIMDSETSTRIERLCRAGLDRNGMENFTLSDHLADRLAEAHGILQKLHPKVGDEGSPSSGLDLRMEIARALALPPDLESMIARRRPL